MSLYRRMHARVLKVVEELDEEHLRARPGRSNSIAFNIWHVARWDDNLHWLLPEMTPELRKRLAATQEIWTAERLASRWGFPPPERLGHSQTGMGMDEAVAAGLALPAKDVLLDYARGAFAALEAALAAVDDAELSEVAEVDRSRTPWMAANVRSSTVASWILGYLDHAERHLGMMEALRGIQGLRGTASV